MPPNVPWLPALFHAWGFPKPPGVAEIDAFARLAALGPSGLQFREWSAADYVLVPFDWSWTFKSHPARRAADDLLDRARRAGKSVLVFYWSDDERPVPAPGAFVFRTSVRKTPDYGRSVFAMPGWLRDPREIASADAFAFRSWSPRPSVGFCGLTAPRVSRSIRLYPLRRAVKRFAYRFGLSPFPDLTPNLLRRTALDRLANDSRIDSIFIERNQFFGGAALLDGTYDDVKHADVKHDYVNNILGTDYTLCVRGAGNFSHRYFDTLASGRIPLLLDTGGGIPYDFLVDWKECGPVVSARSLRELPDALLAFHNKLGPDDFRELQLRNRHMYERYLSPEGFFATFPLHFQST